MKTTNERTVLQEKICLLKDKQADDFLMLKKQYYTTIDSFKPINILKSSIQDAITSPDLKSNLIKGAIRLGTNYLTTKLPAENSGSTIKQVLGNVLKFAFKNFIGKKSKKI